MKKPVKEKIPPAKYFSSITVVGLFITTLILIYHASQYNFISDDAFIIARYARNVARGVGWVYNIGERVEGYSSFAWVALTAIPGFFGIDFVDAVRGLSLIGSILCLLIMYLSSPLLGVSPRGLISCLGGFLMQIQKPVCYSFEGTAIFGVVSEQRLFFFGCS